MNDLWTPTKTFQAETLGYFDPVTYIADNLTALYRNSLALVETRQPIEISNNWEPIPFDLERADQGDHFDIEDGERIVYRKAGIRLVLGSIRYESQQNGRRFGRLRLNGRVDIANVGGIPNAATPIRLQVPALWYFREGDSVTLDGYLRGTTDQLIESARLSSIYLGDLSDAGTWTAPLTFTDGAAPTVTQFNQQFRDNPQYLHDRIACSLWTWNNKLHNSTGNWVGIDNFSVNLFKTRSGLWSPDSNPGRAIITEAGSYLYGGCLKFAANATGDRYVRIRENDTDTVADFGPLVGETGIGARMPLVDFRDFAVNDYLTIEGWQDSGGNLDLQSHWAFAPTLWFIKVD